VPRRTETETHLAVEEGDYFRECREQMLDGERAWVYVALSVYDAVLPQLPIAPSSHAGILQRHACNRAMIRKKKQKTHHTHLRYSHRHR
jgi:hypothetical protein